MDKQEQQEQQEQDNNEQQQAEFELGTGDVDVEFKEPVNDISDVVATEVVEQAELVNINILLEKVANIEAQQILILHSLTKITEGLAVAETVPVKQLSLYEQALQDFLK